MKLKFIASLLTSVFIFSGLAHADETQDAFLADMASGLNARWAVTSDISEDLTKAELGYIEKYKDTAFEDEKFDKIAHMYIDGVLLQNDASGYENSVAVLFNYEWQSGYIKRGIAMIELYDNYGLAIGQEDYSVMKADMVALGAITDIF